MKSVSRGGGEGGSNKRIDGEEGGHLEDEMQAKERCTGRIGELGQKSRAAQRNRDVPVPTVAPSTGPESMFDH